MLKAIAADMSLAQTPAQQLAKSHGRAPRSSDRDTGAEEHGSDRFGRGLGLGELLAEFRSLRAAVLRQWMAQRGTASVEMLHQLMLFNEGIDQAVAESAARFMAETRAKEDAGARYLQEEAEARRQQEERAPFGRTPARGAARSAHGLLGMGSRERPDGRLADDGRPAGPASRASAHLGQPTIRTAGLRDASAMRACHVPRLGEGHCRKAPPYLPPMNRTILWNPGASRWTPFRPFYP